MTSENVEEDRTLLDILAENDEHLKSRFESPELTQYLSSITSRNLPDILQEPTNLASEASQLTNSLTSLCHNEYPTFLSLHRTTSVLSSTLSSFSTSLSSLMSTLPTLEASTKKFSVESQSVQEARRKARLVLEQHDALVDVLDIPALIDTCVRNKFYQEAMDLAAHARSLASRFPDIPVVQDVAAESTHAMQSMLTQLLAILSEPVKLPALYKAVSFIRKMGVLPELKLALAFLTSRSSSLEDALNGIEKDQTDHARYIRRFVDAWREGVHDVITQFNTIFLERSPSEELSADLAYLLSTFTTYMIDVLLDVLSENLSKVEDTTYLPSILTQLTHCSVSFSRLGLDFRALLPPLFEEAVRTIFTTSLEDATDKFVRTLSDAQKYSKQPSQWLVTPAAASSPPEDIPSPSTELARIPPQVISSYPPVATYLNAILNDLNGLRLLAPLSLESELAMVLDKSLARASSAFLLYAQMAVDSSLSKKSRGISMDEDAPDHPRIIRAAGKVFSRLMVPYARRAFSEGVYSARASERTVSELEKDLHQWDSWLTTATDS